MSTPSLPQTRYFRSIFLPGLYALQCVSRVSGAPDVTIYRENLEALVGDTKTSQLALMKAQKRFSFFILRHTRDRGDCFDKRGRLVTVEADKPVAYATAMSASPVRCDNGSLAQQSTWLLPNPTVCGSFEAHSGQSAADRGNFYTMLDQLLNQAGSDKDREHIYVLSHHSPCPRSALVADLTKTTDRTQELFLDYFRRIQKGWPLHDVHHKTELSRTLSSCRYGELRAWLKGVRMRTSSGEDPHRFDLVLSSIPLQVRFALAKAFVDVFYSKVLLVEGGVEQIADADVYHRSAEIGAAMDQLLATPMSNI